MFKKKKEDFSSALLEELISYVKSQNEIWETVHKRKSVYKNIAVDSWFNIVGHYSKSISLLIMRLLLNIVTVFSIVRCLRKKFCLLLTN